MVNRVPGTNNRYQISKQKNAFELHVHNHYIVNMNKKNGPKNSHCTHTKRRTKETESKEKEREGERKEKLRQNSRFT